MEEDDWQVAGGRRRRNKGGGSAATGPPHASHAALQLPTMISKPPTERQVQQRCAAVAAAAGEVAEAPFWPALSQQLGALPPHCAPAALKRMVVYGLGSLEQPGAAHIRYQLALATLLVGLLPSLAAPPEAFDPVFSLLDHAVLEKLNVQVMPHDERGRRVARQPTLFWMPHCEAALTDALLAANLEAGTLQNVVVLGNRFSGYQASWALPHRAQQQSTGGGGTSGSNAGSSGSRIAQLERPTTMLRLCEQGVAQEQRVSECRFPVASAFNDLGLHWFPPAWRQRLESGMEGLSVS